jgi:hypothetical protein
MVWYMMDYDVRLIGVDPKFYGWPSPVLGKRL